MLYIGCLEIFFYPILFCLLSTFVVKIFIAPRYYYFFHLSAFVKPLKHTLTQRHSFTSLPIATFLGKAVLIILPNYIHHFSSFYFNSEGLLKRL